MVGQRGRTRRNVIGNGLVAVVDGYGREPGRFDNRSDGESVKSESPSVTWMVEVTDTAEGIFPSASAGKTYSPSDWLMV